MKSFRILTAAVIATSLLGSAAMAAETIATTDTSTPVAKTDVKSDVKAPVKAKHVHHKKATTVKSDSSKDNSVKTETTTEVK